VARTLDSSGKRLNRDHPLSLRERDPVAYWVEQARHSAARRLVRVIRQGLDGELAPDKLGSISIGLKAALAVLGLPGNLPDPSRSQQASVTINLGVALQQHEPSHAELRPGGLTLSLGERDGET
jgi:hypothetical protein